MPGILQAIAENENNFKEINIFELSQVYENKADNLPDEKLKLCLALSGQEATELFLAAKGVLAALLAKLFIKDFSLAADQAKIKMWPAGQVWRIISGSSSDLGQSGLISRETLQLFGVKSAVALVEIDFTSLAKAAQTGPSYQPLAKFPAIELDLSVEIGNGVSYGDVVKTVKKVSPLITEVLFLSVFRGQNIPEGHKALAIRIVYRDLDKTLELDEAQKIHEQVVVKLKKEYNVRVR